MLISIKSNSKNSIDVIVKKRMNQKQIGLALVRLCCFSDIAAAGVVFMMTPLTVF